MSTWAPTSSSEAEVLSLLLKSVHGGARFTRLHYVMNNTKICNQHNSRKPQVLYFEAISITVLNTSWHPDRV